MKNLLRTFQKPVSRASTFTRGMMIGVLMIQFSSPACQSSENPKRQNSKSLLNILASNEFKVVRQVAHLPAAVLSAAQAIPGSRTLESIMVDPGRDYQGQHSGIDFSKPTAQLVFGAIAERYVLMCYWTGGLTRAEHLMLIRHDSDGARVVAKGVVYPPAKTFAELKKRLVSQDYVPFDLQSTYIVPLVPD